MKTSLEGLGFIAALEGCCQSKYFDSRGVATIGVGATVTEIPDLDLWPLSKSISVQECFTLLKKSVIKYENAISHALTKPVAQFTFDALVSWCYNVGVGWPSKASIISLLNAGIKDKDRLKNALLMFDQPKEIIGRRKKEADLLVNGNYGAELVNLFPVSDKGTPVYNKGKVVDAKQYLQ